MNMRFLFNDLNDKETVPTVGWAYFDIDNPVVAWEAYRGHVYSKVVRDTLGIPPLTLWLASRLKQSNSIETRNEFRLEFTRRNKFQDKISRLTGFFHFEDSETAKKAKSWRIQYMQEPNLAEIGFSSSYMFSKHDAEWITNYRWQEDDLSWIEKYWAGEPCPNSQYGPIWELITNDTGLIWGTELRQKAFDNISKTIPNSVGLLDLARVAAEGGFPAGHVTPSIHEHEKGKFKLRTIFRDQEFHSPEFRSYVESYKGPKRDLRIYGDPEALFEIPNFTPFEFELDDSIVELESLLKEQP